MEAHERSIEDVFRNSRILQIPFFQRGYTWNETDNWERFANDMESLVINRDNDYKYFLGSLILKKTDLTEQELDESINEKFIVVDGQQRLTTLSVYLKALVNRLPEDDTYWTTKINYMFLKQRGQRLPVLQPGVNDRGAYQDVMLGEPTNERQYPSRQIAEAYEYFRRRYADTSWTPAAVDNLLNAILGCVSFVSIVLNQNDDEQQIFDTINSTGVKLTIDELMKNYLYDSNKETEYNSNWKPVFESDGASLFWKKDNAATAQAATDKNTMIYNFFYDFVRVKMWDYRDCRGFNVKAFVQKNRVLETCKAFVERFGADKQELANEIIEYAKLYKEYFDEARLRTPIPRTSNIDRIACIAITKESTLKPYLLYVLRNVESVIERNAIFELLEIYIVRRAICDCSNKMAQEFYAEQLIGHQINSVQALREYLNNVDPMAQMHMPSNAEVEQSIHTTRFSKETTPRLIYYLQESKLWAVKKGYSYNLAETLIPNKRNSRVYPPHREHDLEQERQRRIKTIGNFVLLQMPAPEEYINENEERTYKLAKRAIAQSSDTPFADKQGTLLNYMQNVQSMGWVRDHRANWSEEDIDKRNSLIANMINRLWPIDNE